MPTLWEDFIIRSFQHSPSPGKNQLWRGTEKWQCVRTTTPGPLGWDKTIDDNTLLAWVSFFYETRGSGWIVGVVWGRNLAHPPEGLSSEVWVNFLCWLWKGLRITGSGDPLLSNSVVEFYFPFPEQVRRQTISLPFPVLLQPAGLCPWWWLSNSGGDWWTACSKCRLLYSPTPWGQETFVVLQAPAWLGAIDWEPQLWEILSKFEFITSRMRFAWSLWESGSRCNVTWLGC